MTRIFIVLLSILIFGCSEPEHIQSELSKAIWAELERNGFESIDFSSLAGEKKWTRVCFLGPYNESSSDLLGFGLANR